MSKVPFFLSLIVLFLFGCCSTDYNEVQLASKEQNIFQGNLIEKLNNSTILLFKIQDDKTYDTICGGVFVSPTKILTAKHCLTGFIPPLVIDAKLPNITQYLIDIVAQNPKPDSYVGLIVPFTTYEHRFESFSEKNPPSFAVIHGVTEHDDLALIEAINYVHDDYLPISKDKGELGETVHIIGHPDRLEYSYSSGYISKFDMDDGRNRIQITGANIYFGSSGGLLADGKGKLLGICSSFNPRVGSAFFVPSDTIIDFVKDEI